MGEKKTDAEVEVEAKELEDLETDEATDLKVKGGARKRSSTRL